MRENGHVWSVAAALAVTAFGVTACSGEDTGSKTDTSQPSESAPTDACTCSAPSVAGSPAVVPLECLCGEGQCPTFEELAEGLQCTFGTEWTWTRHEGCGRVEFAFHGGLGGTSYIYDASTRELIGITHSSDAAVDDVCGASSYRAGVEPSCREGSYCALCQGSDECVSACSPEAFERQFGTVDQLILEDVAGVHDCGGQESQRVTVGCGRIRIGASEDAGGSAFEFDAATHALLAFTRGSNDEGQHCGGVWGELGAPCAEETTCSLCEGDANVCQF